MMATVIPIKGSRTAPKAIRSTMETLIVSVEEVTNWRIPPFQRPIRVNDKVRAIAEELKRNACELSGVITLGRVDKDPALWVVDGQHRLEAFRISGLKEVIADLRICHFDTMSEMATEFVRLNTALVRMRPDDILRGLETTVPAVAMIRKQCEFVGYDQVRRGSSTSPVLSMSAVVRCWYCSNGETPTSSTSGFSMAQIAEAMDGEAVQNLTTFLLTAHAAWGRDSEYFRLWGNLNMTVCMWTFRQLVLDRTTKANRRYVSLNIAQFKTCLMALSADSNYVDWLQGRQMNDRDRSPCYTRMKVIFVRRIAEQSHGAKPKLPSPAWASK